jgi:hypothetical protein
VKNDVHHSQIQKQYEQLQREQMEKEYAQKGREQQEQQERQYEQMRQGSMDSYNNQEQFDPRQNEPNNHMQDFHQTMDVNRDEITQTPEHEEKRNNYRRELEKENTSIPRDRMPSPYNPANHQPTQKQVQFQTQPQVYQDQVSETHSKQGDFRSKVVVEDVGKILNKLYYRS